MAHDKERYSLWGCGDRDVGDEFGYVGDDLGRGAGEAALSGLADGFAPSALVEAVDGDAGGG